MNEKATIEDRSAALAKRTQRLTDTQRRLLDQMLREDAGADRAEVRTPATGDRTPGFPLLGLCWDLVRHTGESMDRALSAWMRPDPFTALWREQASPAGELPRAALAGQSPEPLVVMRGSGRKTPFFCVHALLGSVFHYHKLASLMDPEQPFYGLQAPGLDGTEAPLDSVKAFAARYLRSMREVQRQGPYKLGGYSFGSWIALEMANQLVEEGEDVRLVAIFGTGVPLSVSMPLLYEQLAFASQYMEDFEKNIVQPFLPYAQRMQLAAGEDPLAALPPLVRIVVAHNRAALRFEPRPYPGELTLFETVDQQLRTPLDATRGWKRLSTRSVRTHLVSGNHLNMLDEPHVHDLAQKLTACLDAC